MYFTHDFFCGTTQNVLPNTGIPRNSGFGGGEIVWVIESNDMWSFEWLILKGVGGWSSIYCYKNFPGKIKKKP